MAHAHGHNHDHGANIKHFGRAFAIGIALNLIFVVVEAAGGWWANSSALLSDAGHNLSDVLTLILAWGASRLGQRPSTARYTYGFKSATIQAALLNAALLYLALGIILWEAVNHLRNPEPINSGLVMLLAGIGVVVNGITALLFRSGQKDVNVRGAYLHMLTDMLVSVGVVVGGAVVYFTGWQWIDPIISFVVLAIIAVGSWGLLRETVQLSLQGVPESIDPTAVRQFLLTQPGVTDVHDLHIWPLSTRDTALTAHLVRPDGADNAFLQQIQHRLHEEFDIGHTTVQVEQPDMHCHSCGMDENVHS